MDDQLPKGYDSTRAAQLREQLPAKDSAVAVILFTGDLDRAKVAKLGPVVTDLSVDRVSVPKKVAVVPSRDGTAAISIVSVDTTDSTENADAVKSLRRQLDDTVPDGVEAQVTGPAAVQADLAAVFDGADFRLLAATASVVAVLLVITYRSPILWVIPLLVVGVADQTASVLATQVLAGLSIPWDESTTGILSVLVFGAGTDYALLLISRYRDELRAHEDRHEAMLVALRRTSHAVLASATTVVLGVLSLTLSVIPTTRALGIACAVGIVVAATFALVALPATLVVFGRWVFWPKIPRVGTESLADGHSLWRRVGDRGEPAYDGLRRRHAAPPRRALRGAGRRQARPPHGRAVPADARGDLGRPAPGEVLPGRQLGPHRGADPLAREGSSHAEGPRRASTPSGSAAPARDGPSSTWCSTTAPDSAGAAATVERMRDALVEVDRSSHVGGTTAEAIDEGASATRDRWVIIPVILLLVLGALVLLLRSLVAPVVLVGTVLATYVASLGASWWLFTRCVRVQRGQRGCAVCWRSCSWSRSAWTTTSSWSPGAGRRPRGTAPTTGCCARWQPPVA